MFCKQWMADFYCWWT